MPQGGPESHVDRGLHWLSGWGVNITLSSLPWTFPRLRARPGGAEVLPTCKLTEEAALVWGCWQETRDSRSETENYDDSDASR